MFSRKALTVCAVALLSASTYAEPCTVVLPQSPNRGEQRAAAELTEHLGQALNAEIAIKREGEASGKTLLVGRTLAAKAADTLTGSMETKNGVSKPYQTTSDPCWRRPDRARHAVCRV